MTNESTATGMQSWLSQFTTGMPHPVDWTKPVSEGPLKFCSVVFRQMLTGTARQLQIQADYMGRLAECNNPAEAIAMQGELVQKSIACCVESGQQIASAMGKDKSSAP